MFRARVAVTSCVQTYNRAKAYILMNLSIAMAGYASMSREDSELITRAISKD